MIRPVIFSLLFFFVFNVHGKTDFLKLFSKPKPIIAALMIEKDLSDPKKISKAIQWGKEQIKIAESSGMDGILFEFRGGKILKPEISEDKYRAMKTVAQALVASSKSLVVGVEILWHYPEQTLRLAKDSGARFVRVDFFSDEVMADKQKVPIDPQKILNYKKKIAAEDIVLLTDIQVKYSKMIDPNISLETSAKRAIASGSEGVIVTSTKSGRAPNPDRPRLAKKGAGQSPVVIGSGFSHANAAALLTHADAAIVGTSISVKTGGPLVAKKVNELMSKVFEFRNKEKLRVQ